MTILDDLAKSLREAVQAAPADNVVKEALLIAADRAVSDPRLQGHDDHDRSILVGVIAQYAVNDIRRRQLAGEITLSVRMTASVIVRLWEEDN